MIVVDNWQDASFQTKSVGFFSAILNFLLVIFIG